MAGEGYETPLDRVLELAMTAFGSHVLPSVGFEKLLDFPYLHDIRISGGRSRLAGLTNKFSGRRSRVRCNDGLGHEVR